MDIEEFYAADERRRRSAELEFGRAWSGPGEQSGVSWIEDTGELYLMSEPSGAVTGTGAGDLEVLHVSERQLSVEVLGVVNGRAAISAVMSGWQDAMSRPDGLAWLRDRVQHAAEHAGDTPATPSEELPEDKS